MSFGYFRPFAHETYSWHLSFLHIFRRCSFGCFRQNISASEHETHSWHQTFTQNTADDHVLRLFQAEHLTFCTAHETQSWHVSFLHIEYPASKLSTNSQLLSFLHEIGDDNIL
jgi:hypothetical protein